MNILFVFSNINGFSEECYSFGLASIVSMARVAGYKVKVVIVKTKNDYLKVLDTVNNFKPKVVGFTSVSSQFNFIKEIAALIKKKSPSIINVCGGVHPTINPECIKQADSLDAIFVGESENSFIEFLQRIERGEGYKDTDNLAYLEQGRVIRNKLKPLIANLDSLPYPDKEIYPFEDEVKTIGYAPFLFSRGCPYLCSYCSNHAIAKAYNLSKNYPRYKSAESSICEIEDAINKFRIDTVLIEDDIFGLDRGWREEFCEKYKKRIGIKFICLLRVNLVSEDFIKLLKSIGCYRILIGIESGNEYVRNNIMNRKMSNTQIIRAFDIIKKFGIETHAINIIGIPGETESMIWDTIKLNRKVTPTTSGINIFYPYKGTRLGNYCFDNGLVNEDLYDAFSNERRETVLNYPEDHKMKLVYFRKNWEALVYPFDYRRFLLRLARKTFIWKYLCILKRIVCSLWIISRKNIGSGKGVS